MRESSGGRGSWTAKSSSYSYTCATRYCLEYILKEVGLTYEVALDGDEVEQNPAPVECVILKKKHTFKLIVNKQAI